MTKTFQEKLRGLEIEFLHGFPVHLPEQAIHQITELVEEQEIKTLETITQIWGENPNKSLKHYVINKLEVYSERAKQKETE